MYLEGIRAINSSPEGQSFSLYTIASPSLDLGRSEVEKEMNGHNLRQKGIHLENVIIDNSYYVHPAEQFSGLLTCQVLKAVPELFDA